MSIAGKYIIEVDALKCTGCRRCQLICSLHHEGRFSPNASRIVIDEHPQGVDSVTFTDDCDLCGLCVRYCVYGALRFEKET